MKAPENNFPSAIRELRARLGLTQEKLAAQLRVSFPTVNRWEKGKNLPDSAVRHAILQFVQAQGPDYADLQKLFAVETPSADTAPISTRRRRQTQPANGGDQLMDNRSMEALLWKAACSIRGEKDAPKFKDYILPLMFIKRLSDVFEDEVTRLAEEFGDQETARTVLEADPSLVRFYIPPEATWPVVSGRTTFDWPEDRKPKTLGEQLTTTIRAIAKANPSLQGVIDIVDYNETRNGEREISDEALARLIETLSDPRYRLGLKDVEPDFLGRAYEYLLRKFAEGQGQSAGEFFTPKEVGWLIARLMNPQQGEEVYDPCCGSGGLLVKCDLVLTERDKKVDRPLKLHGQELTGSSFAIARMNMVLHDMAGEIVRGNTMSNPKFLEDSRLRQFDIVVTNPMWNQDNFDPKSYENDPYERFETRGGYASASSADWAWLQHVAASLSRKGRGAVVIDTGAASRGSGGQGENKEKSIRRWFVDRDLIEGVILLPDNLFYNTTAAGLILVLNAAKPKARRGQVLLVNASAGFRKGRPKNELTEDAILQVVKCFGDWKENEGFCSVVGQDVIVEADYNLSPARYIRGKAAERRHNLDEAIQEYRRLVAIQSEIDLQIEQIFASMGYAQRLFREGLRGEPLKQTEIGEIPQSWEVVRLGDVSLIERGKFAHRPRNDPRFYGGTIPFIQTGDVARARGRLRTYTQTLNDLGLSVSRIFPKGTIVITIAANIGDTAILDIDAAFPDSLVGITPTSAANTEYLEFFLRTQKEEMNRLAPKGTQKNINIEFLRPWLIALPSSLDEQLEIAAILRTVEQRELCSRSSLSKLNELFSGLLHQLMTGAIRVKDLNFTEVSHA